MYVTSLTVIDATFALTKVSFNYNLKALLPNFRNGPLAR